MEAIIIADQNSDKLKRHIGEIPTTMAMINGKPLISYIIANLVNQGFDNVVVIVGKGYDVIEDYIGFEFLGMRVSYKNTNKSGTLGDTIRKALKEIKSNEVFLLDGSTFFHIPLGQLQEKLMQQKAHIVMALKKCRAGQMDYFVKLGTKSHVQNVSAAPGEGVQLGFAGACIVKRKFIEDSSEQVATLFNGNHLNLPAAEKKIFGLPFDDFFIRLSTPEEYLRAHDEFTNHKIR